MTSKRRTSIVLVGLVLVLTLVLAFCVPTPTPPVSTPTPGPESKVSFTCTSNQNLTSPLPTNPYFVLGQVILTGSPQDLDEILPKLGDLGIKLTPAESCTFSGLSAMPAVPGGFPLEPGPEAGGPNPFYDRQNGRIALAGDELAINLYQIDSGHTVEEAVSAVESLTSDGSSLLVFADPNYLTGHLAGSPCSDPFGVEGSPFGVEGSPFGVEGSPAGGQGIPAESADFWEQWAFDEIGLSRPSQRKGPLGGDIQVAIFDTSPFRDDNQTGDDNATFPVDEAPLDLAIHQPFRLHVLTPPSTYTPTFSVKDHGVFVAGLVHAVAPDSKILLYRVLSQRGCGDMYQLVRAITDYAVQLGGRGEKTKAVINLSLGIQKPRLSTGGYEAVSRIDGVSEDVLAAYRMAETERAIESLSSAVHLAYEGGAVIVAAAGNNSVRDPQAPDSDKLIVLESDVPAAFEDVLGVAASGPGGTPACYSNKGEVVAPGAQAGFDDRLDIKKKLVPHCVPLAEACVAASASAGPITGADCPTGVISLTTTGSTGYSYWVGTSFATPLTSGLAALYYQDFDQDQIYNQIKSGATPLSLPLLADHGLIHIP